MGSQEVRPPGCPVPGVVYRGGGTGTEATRPLYPRTYLLGTPCHQHPPRTRMLPAPRHAVLIRVLGLRYCRSVRVTASWLPYWLLPRPAYGDPRMRRQLAIPGIKMEVQVQLITFDFLGQTSGWTSLMGPVLCRRPWPMGPDARTHGFHPRARIDQKH